MNLWKGLFTSTQATNTAPISEPNPNGSPDVKVNTNQPEGNNQNIPNPTNAPNPNAEFNILDMWGRLSQNKPSEESLPPSLTFSSEALDQAAAKLDFSKLIPDSGLEAVAAGLAKGDVAPLKDLLASALSNSWKMGMAHNSTLTDKFVKDTTTFQEKAAGVKVREQVLTSQLTSIKDMHPVAKEFAIGAAKKLSAQFPEASPQEIEANVIDMMKSFSGELDVKGKLASQAATAKETNWDEWADN